jgi:hypothetical protein
LTLPKLPTTSVNNSRYTFDIPQSSSISVLSKSEPFKLVHWPKVNVKLSNFQTPYIFENLFLTYDGGIYGILTFLWKDWDLEFERVEEQLWHGGNENGF